MQITRRALERMKQLRDRAGVPETSGVRLLLRGGQVLLQWDRSVANAVGFRIIKRGLSILIDAGTYSHLADYELDYDERQARRFLLSPIGVSKTDGKVPGRQGS